MANSKVAVLNEVHSVGLHIEAKMLKAAGYDVWLAGESFRKLVPLYHKSGQVVPEISGEMQVGQMPPDALYVDTHPHCEAGLRKAGWNGSILIMLLMPVGPDWMAKEFRPGPKVGVLAWSAAVGRWLRETNPCPHDYFWPTYFGLDMTLRGSFGDYLMTIVENASGWSNVPVLEQLRDHPEAKLQLFGGGPPDWSRRIPQADLFMKMKSCLAMYHLKPFDTPGFAVMEAALQGIPIIFPPDWLRCTENELFKDGENCLVVETKCEAVVEAARRLKDPAENSRIGMAGQNAVMAATDWSNNLPRFERLVDAIK
jgi:hypothetical protein